MYNHELESTKVSKEALEQLAACETRLLAKSRAAEGVYQDRAIEEYLQMLDVTGFTLPFDYQDWASTYKMDLDLTEKKQVVSLIKSGDINTVRGIMTMVVRRNRFESGYLEELTREGLIPALRERIHGFLKEAQEE